MTILISLFLLIVLLISATLSGILFLKLLKFDSIDRTINILFSIALGLGITAILIFGLAKVGRMSMVGVFGAVLVSGLMIYWVVRKRSDWVSVLRKQDRGVDHLGFDEKIFWVLATALFVLTLLQALTPPWDYDGLMYHLQGPRLFLEAGRIVPLPENWLTYYPFLVEMLFSLGLIFGSDSFAKLIHVVFAVLLAAATYSAAGRCIGRKHAWLAAAILVGIPIFPIWAGFAYSDMAWALYEFLGVYAVLIWIESRQGSIDNDHNIVLKTGAREWTYLVLAGIMMGFALGTKYMALGGVGALGLVVVWQSRQDGWRQMLRNGAIFGLTALLIGCPWYLKNWLWTGNPVYPFFISPGGDIGERVALWLEYMNGFGAPRTFLGYLSLPILLYVQHYRFGTFLGSIEIPSILFPLAIFYPLMRRTVVLNALGVWALIRFGVWALGAQQTRFLLPLFPALSILAAYVLVELASRLRGITGRVLVRGLGFGMLAVALVYSILFFMSVRPLGVIFGAETRADFLRRQLPVYAFQEYIQANLPPEARVWMLWDGRGYYCGEGCVPDIDQSRWTQIAMHSWDVDRVAEELKDRGATHLLISKQDANFIAQFDRSGLQARAQNFLQSKFQPACTRKLVSDEFYDLVELTCR